MFAGEALAVECQERKVSCLFEQLEVGQELSLSLSPPSTVQNRMSVDVLKQKKT